MKVSIDEFLCVGDEACVHICPEIFEMRGHTAETKLREVPGDLWIPCLEAAEACPRAAITIQA